MRIYAEFKDYKRNVGIIPVKTEENGMVRYGGFKMNPDDPYFTAFHGSIEHLLYWGPEMAPGNMLTGNETIVLKREDVQMLFDALWDAGIRPSGNKESWT